MKSWERIKNGRITIGPRMLLMLSTYLLPPIRSFLEMLEYQLEHSKWQKEAEPVRKARVGRNNVIPLHEEVVVYRLACPDCGSLELNITVEPGPVGIVCNSCNTFFDEYSYYSIFEEEEPE